MSNQEAERKPPLRPLAPPPAMSCSISAIRRPGSRSVSWIAVHSPANPPPTMHTSATRWRSSGGAGSPGSSASASCSQKLRAAPGDGMSITSRTSPPNRHVVTRRAAPTNIVPNRIATPANVRISVAVQACTNVARIATASGIPSTSVRSNRAYVGGR